ncbi:MAG: hypothetical protein V4710_17340 [Verrucomicrobiota bacterium]
MHFEFLVEDESGRRMLERLVPKILKEEEHTFTIHAYKGIGRIPKGLNPRTDPAKRVLLDQLPRLLGGYGQRFAHCGAGYRAAVIVVCDLDDRNLKEFTKELLGVMAGVMVAPQTGFCIAVEEGEAWLLGDKEAVRKAYPKAKTAVLDSYRNDSICGTWEKLAEAVYPGGVEALRSQGFQVVGQEKSRWAETITPHMDVEANQSPSFGCFLKTLKEMAASGDCRFD